MNFEIVNNTVVVVFIIWLDLVLYLAFIIKGPVLVSANETPTSPEAGGVSSHQPQQVLAGPGGVDAGSQGPGRGGQQRHQREHRQRAKTGSHAAV